MSRNIFLTHLLFDHSFLFFFSIAVPIFSKSSLTMKCSGEWIGVREKCFYFSDDTRDWTASKNFCSSQGSELAQIDTKEDMVRKGESFQSFQSLSLYEKKIKRSKVNTQ